MTVRYAKKRRLRGQSHRHVPSFLRLWLYIVAAAIASFALLALLGAAGVMFRLGDLAGFQFAIGIVLLLGVLCVVAAVVFLIPAGLVRLSESVSSHGGHATDDDNASSGPAERVRLGWVLVTLAVMAIGLGAMFGFAETRHKYGPFFTFLEPSQRSIHPDVVLNCGSPWRPVTDSEVLAQYPAINEMSGATPEEVLQRCHHATRAGRTISLVLVGVAVLLLGACHKRRSRAHDTPATRDRRVPATSLGP